MPAVDQLPLLRVSEGGRRATLEISAGTALELTKHDALLCLARERGLLVDQQLVRALATAATEFAASGGSMEWSAVVAECTPAQHGTDACFEWHERIAAEIADADGLRQEADGSIDFTTGNIDFVGSLRITEGVRDNFIVRATGDVTIHGLIEAATLIIGGDLHAPMGVAARGQGAMLVDGSLKSGYLNGLRGRVRGDVTIRRELIGCELIVGGNVKVERGPVLGGILVCGGSLSAESIGSDGGAKTTVAIGCRPMEARRAGRMSTLAKELSLRLPPLEDRAFQLEELGPNAKACEKEEGTELAFEMAEIHRRVRAINAKRRELLLDMGLDRVVRVEIQKSIFRGTTLKVGTREVRFDTTIKGPLVIVWDESRELYIRIGSGTAQQLREVAVVRDLAA